MYVSPTQRVLSLLVLSCSLAQGTATAEVYFFRPKAGGPYGNQSGTSYDNAWHLDDSAIDDGAITWGTGTGQVGPGDTLYVCGLHDGGQYDRRIQPTISGGAGSGNEILVSGACPGDPGTIYGVGKRLSSGWNSVGGGVYYQTNVGNASMHNLERESGTTGDTSVIRLARVPPSGSPAICNLDASTPNGTYCYQPASGGNSERLYYKPSGGQIANKIVYTGGVERIVRIDGVDNIHISDLRLRLAATDLIRIDTANNVAVRDSDLAWSATRGIRIVEDSDNGLINGNLIHDVALGLSMESNSTANNNDAWTISENEIFDIDQDGYYCDDDSEGIGIQGGSNITVEHNDIHDLPGVGINFYSFPGQEQKGNRARFNKVHDIADLDPDRCDGVGPLSGRQEKGIQYQKGNVGHDPDDTTGNVVHHNLVWNIARIGLRTTSQKSTNGPTWAFANNVVYSANVSLAWAEGSGTGLTSPAATFRNNISLSPTGPNPLHVGQDGYYASADRTALAISSNLFFPDGSTSSPRFRWANSDIASLADWQVASGLDPDSITADPVLANPTAGNFLPQSMSPTIDAGAIVTVGGVDINEADFAGRPVMVEVDLGAYEYGDIDSGILGYYRMEETWTGNPGDVNDSGPAAIDGRSLNGAATSSSSAFLGSAGGSFSGASSHAVTFGDAGWGLGSNSFTMSAWVKTTYSGGSQRVVCKGGGGAVGDYCLSVQTNGKARFLIRDLGGSYRIANGTVGVNDGNWHHLVAVLADSGAADSISLWVDGTKEGEVTGFSSGAVNTSSSNQISQLGGPVTGSVDEVTVYGRALTQTEILALYNEGSGVVLNTP